MGYSRFPERRGERLGLGIVMALCVGDTPSELGPSVMEMALQGGNSREALRHIRPLVIVQACPGVLNA